MKLVVLIGWFNPHLLVVFLNGNFVEVVIQCGITGLGGAVECGTWQ